MVFGQQRADLVGAHAEENPIRLVAGLFNDFLEQQQVGVMRGTSSPADARALTCAFPAAQR